MNMASPFFPPLGDCDPPVFQFTNVIARSEKRLRAFVYYKYPIGDLFVSPGHSSLEERASSSSDSGLQPILINIRTTQTKFGRIRLERAEIWDGHHRLLSAFLTVGKDATLSAACSWLASQDGKLVDRYQSEILVDNRNSKGVKYAQWVKLSGLLVHTGVQELARVTGFMADPYSLKWNPEMPYPDQECQLRSARSIPKGSGEPRLGLFFGSFDPIHNGHLDIIDYLLSNDVVRSIVLIPNAEAMGKVFKSPQPHRMKIMEIATQELRKKYPGRLFIFLSNTAWIGSLELRIPFMEAMAVWFGIAVNEVYHIEGLESVKLFWESHPAILLRRGCSSSFRPPGPLHPKTRIENSFLDRWNLSSSLVRQWLQIYRIPHPSIRNPTVEAMVSASLPEPVKKYIEEHALYMAENPFFRLKAKKISERKNFRPQAHKNMLSLNLIQGYLITMGVSERVEAFRNQVRRLEFPVSEYLGFDGEKIDIVLRDKRHLVTNSGSFISTSRGFLVDEVVPSGNSVTLASSIQFPLSNFEVACYLSHHQVWAKAFWKGDPNIMVIEDRAILNADFNRQIAKLTRQLEARKYLLCYLFDGQKDSRSLRAAGKGNLLLTAYLVSRRGLEFLLDDAFPLRQPVDWFVKETMCKPQHAKRVFSASLVERDVSFVTTIPKLSHSW